MFFVLAARSRRRPGQHRHRRAARADGDGAAARAGIPLFLMAIMVGNGANAGALSPFAPTGIIVNGLMDAIGLAGFELRDLSGQPAGARGWSRSAAISCSAAGSCSRQGSQATIDDPTGGPTWSRSTPAHWITLGDHRRARRWRHRLRRCNVGMARVHRRGGARRSPAARTMRRRSSKMPWRVILMVCGVTRADRAAREDAGDRPLLDLLARDRRRRHGHRRRRVRHRRHLGLQQHVRRGAAGVPADGARPGRSASAAATRSASPRR